MRLPENLPLVIEVVDESARIDAILPLLDEMVEDVLVTLERIEVVHYRANKESSNE